MDGLRRTLWANAPGAAELDINRVLIVLAGVVLILHLVTVVAPLTAIPPVAEVAVLGLLKALTVSVLLLPFYLISLPPCQPAISSPSTVQQVSSPTAVVIAMLLLAKVGPGDLTLPVLALLDFLLSNPPCLAVLVVAGLGLANSITTLKLPCMPNTRMIDAS